MAEGAHPLVGQGRRLNQRGFHFAALELWDRLCADPSLEPDDTAILHDEWGKTLFQLSERQSALRHFTWATEAARDEALYAASSMHAAMALASLSEFDRAQRTLSQLIDHSAHLPTLFRAQLHGNLAFVQAHNDFHHEAMENTLKSQHFFSEAGVLAYESDLLTNLGLHHEQLGQMDDALRCLASAADKGRYEHLPSVSELSRLHLALGDHRESIRWAERALDLVWSSILNYEKEELARLCATLSNLSFWLGERGLAMRLIEKGQLLFGQMGMWREWRQTQDVMDAWSTGKSRPRANDPQAVDKLSRFLLLLDAQNAQELIDPRFSALLDARVHYASALCEAVGFTRDQHENLVYACRFCDYGLTAVESEIIANPRRSPSAWDRFTQHPALSVFMLESHAVLPQIRPIILDHHERCDGTGFPNRKTENEIDSTALVLAVADLYATEVAVARSSHSEAIAALEQEAGRALAADLVATFLGLFTATES